MLPMCSALNVGPLRRTPPCKVTTRYHDRFCGKSRRSVQPILLPRSNLLPHNSDLILTPPKDGFFASRLAEAGSSMPAWAEWPRYRLGTTAAVARVLWSYDDGEVQS